MLNGVPAVSAGIRSTAGCRRSRSAWPTGGDGERCARCLLAVGLVLSVAVQAREAAAIGDRHGYCAASTPFTNAAVVTGAPTSVPVDVSRTLLLKFACSVVDVECDDLNVEGRAR